MPAARIFEEIYTLLIICLSFTACTHPTTILPFNSSPPLIKANSSQQIANQYFKLQKAWTRHTEVFDHFEGRLFTSATLMSPRFEEARTNHHQKKLGLSVTERSELLQKRVQQSKKGYLFFVTLSSSDMPKLQRPNIQRKINEVIKGREDELKASLIINGSPFPLSKVDQLTFKRTQALHDDFPYITPVKTGYWLYFKVPSDYRADRLKQKSSPDTKHIFQLRFSSLSATALLEWQLSFQ